jgi:hypothetical protein
MRKTLTAFFLLLLLATGARAQAVANSMTCQQAVAYYEAHGRISVQTGGTVVPIYNGIPVSKRSQLGCPTTGVSVRTTDSRRCTIGYICLPRSR